MSFPEFATILIRENGDQFKIVPEPIVQDATPSWLCHVSVFNAEKQKWVLEQTGGLDYSSDFNNVTQKECRDAVQNAYNSIKPRFTFLNARSIEMYLKEEYGFIETPESNENTCILQKRCIVLSYKRLNPQTEISFFNLNTGKLFKDFGSESELFNAFSDITVLDSHMECPCGFMKLSFYEKKGEKEDHLALTKKGIKLSVIHFKSSGEIASYLLKNYDFYATKTVDRLVCKFVTDKIKHQKIIIEYCEKQSATDRWIKFSNGKPGNYFSSRSGSDEFSYFDNSNKIDIFLFSLGLKKNA